MQPGKTYRRQVLPRQKYATARKRLTDAQIVHDQCQGIRLILELCSTRYGRIAHSLTTCQP